MRSFIGSILLVIVLIFLAITAFYQWDTNSKIDFSIRLEDDPVFKTEKHAISAIKEGKVLEGNSIIEPGAMSVSTPVEEQQTNSETNIPNAEEIPTAEEIR